MCPQFRGDLIERFHCNAFNYISITCIYIYMFTQTDVYTCIHLHLTMPISLVCVCVCVCVCVRARVCVCVMFFYRIMRQKGKVNALSEIVFCKTLIRTQSHSYECFSRVSFESKQLNMMGVCVYCMLFSFRY